MKLLLCAATDGELRPLLPLLDAHRSAHRNDTPDWHIAVTGTGIVNTTFHLTKHLQKQQYDLAINLGICGSFTSQLSPGVVVRIHKDRFGDWGAHEQNGFVDVFDMGLENPDKFPFNDGWIYEQPHPAVPETGVPLVDALTVNTVRESGLELAGYKHNVSQMSSEKALVESMEGAAFFFVCRQFNLPCIQLRAVSNEAGERNKSRWKREEALQNLSEFFVNKILRFL